MKKMIGIKNKSINQVSIINGEDGPTSVFIFGEAQKQSLKIRIRNAIYQSRRKRIEKRIAANPHTLAEVVQYAKDHYDLVEIEVDYTWNIFGISYSGNKSVIKRFKKIARDLYCYYGVSEEDIKNRTKRYSSLVTELSS
jgi:hypothetical protein